MKKAFSLLLACALAAATAFGLDYSDKKLWVHRESGEAPVEKPVDVFFLCPTVSLGQDQNMDVNGTASRLIFKRSVDGQKGIYSDAARFFAPYYRQKTMSHYMDHAAQEVAYGDVRDAFLHFLEHDSKGRPFIIAGFSQGSEHALHLIKDVLAEPKLAKRMVAAYLIGWCITEKDTAAAPQLKPARGESDTGVFVSWNTEAAEVTGSALVPRGARSLCINPLNWKTDATPAPAELNKGAQVGSILGGGTSKPKYCGAVINPKRGTINPIFPAGTSAPSGMGFMGKGVYHAYDPFFFYENLRQNVQRRIHAYTAKHARKHD